MPITAQRIAGGERHGVMFGPERTGLDNDDVALADAILTFRSIPPTPRSTSRRRCC